MGHPASLVAAIVNVIPFLNGSVLDAGSVSCIDAPLYATLILCFARNHFEYDVPYSRSASLYVNSPTRKNPAKARGKGVQSTIVTWIHVPVAVSRAERWISFVLVMITLLYLL